MVVIVTVVFYGEKTLKLRSSVASTLAKHSALSASWPSRVEFVSWPWPWAFLVLCSWMICAISAPASSLKAAVTSCTRRTRFLVWRGAEVCLPSAWKKINSETTLVFYELDLKDLVPMISCFADEITL